MVTVFVQPICTVRNQLCSLPAVVTISEYSPNRFSYIAVIVGFGSRNCVSQHVLWVMLAKKNHKTVLWWFGLLYPIEKFEQFIGQQANIKGAWRTDDQ